MASCDPDGRIAEVIRDRLVCMTMEWHWQLDIARDRLEKELGEP